MLRIEADRAKYGADGGGRTTNLSEAEFAVAVALTLDFCRIFAKAARTKSSTWAWMMPQRSLAIFSPPVVMEILTTFGNATA